MTTTYHEPRLFDGPDYNPVDDNARLTSQIGRVYAAMSDGQWRTLNDIADATGDPHASISAQLRHLRKQRWGGHKVEKCNLGDGLFGYRLIPSEHGLLDGTHVDEALVKCPCCNGRGRVKS